MNNPLIGMSYFLTGFSLMTKPGVKRFVIIPLIINILFFIALFFILFHYTGLVYDWFSQYLPTWLRWLAYLVWILFFIGFLLFFIYAFIIIANLISAPFNSLLAEKVEFYLTGKNSNQFGFMDSVKDLPRIIGRQLAVFVYYFPRLLLIFILFFIPVLQVVAAPLLFLFNAWFMTLTYIDYPSDNHRVPLKEVQDWLQEKNWIAFGFGASVLIAAMIPFLNFFIMPAAVAGATKFWLEEKRKK